MKKIIYIILIFITSSNITIPFRKQISNNLTEENLMFTLYNNIILANITIGTPNINLEINIKMRKYPFYITGPNNLNIPYFEYRNSNSYKYYESEYERINGEEFLYGILSFDNFIIGNEKIKIYRLNFFLASNIKYNSSGVLGLGISPNDKNCFHTGFIKNIKYRKLINLNDFFFDFINENEGNLIIGNLPHIYNKKKYDIKQFQYMRVQVSKVNGQYFDINFENLTYGNNIISDQPFIGELSIENGLIRASRKFGIEIINIFFKKYLDNNLCKFNNFTIGINKMSSFVCDEKINIKEFEDINFSIITKKNVFCLNYQDVFKKFNGKYFFLIYFSLEFGDFWELGEIFLKKYHMCFDQDNKRIGYYFNEKKNKDFFSISWFLVFLFFIIILFMGFVIFYLLKKMKIRRKRANELDDGFDYVMANENYKTIN